MGAEDASYLPSFSSWFSTCPTPAGTRQGLLWHRLLQARLLLPALHQVLPALCQLLCQVLPVLHQLLRQVLPASLLPVPALPRLPWLLLPEEGSLLRPSAALLPAPQAAQLPPPPLPADRGGGAGAAGGDHRRCPADVAARGPGAG